MLWLILACANGIILQLYMSKDVVIRLAPFYSYIQTTQKKTNTKRTEEKKLENFYLRKWKALNTMHSQFRFLCIFFSSFIPHTAPLSSDEVTRCGTSAICIQAFVRFIERKWKWKKNIVAFFRIVIFQSLGSMQSEQWKAGHVPCNADLANKYIENRFKHCLKIV